MTVQVDPAVLKPNLDLALGIMRSLTDYRDKGFIAEEGRFEDLPAPVVEAAARLETLKDRLSAGLEEGVFLEDSLGEIFEIPAEGVVVNGYTTEQGQMVPEQLIRANLLAPGEPRLLVPTAQLQTDFHLYVQRGLLSGELLSAVRSEGIQVDEFMLSDIPETNPQETNVFVAAVQHNSDAERRIRQYGSLLVNLYGSSEAVRPQTPTALATLIRVARRFDGLLRLEGITVDEVSGIASLALAA